MFKRWILSVVGVLLAAAPGVMRAPAADATSSPAASAPAGGAEGYYRWLTGCMDAIEKDLPAVVKSAEAAAKLYVEQDYKIGACGGDPFVREVFNRSGGMMQLKALEPLETGNFRPARVDKAIVLMGLREDRLDELVRKCVEFRKGGNTVIAFARRELLDKARAAGARFDFEIVNHAAPHGGLFPDRGDPAAPPPTAPATAPPVSATAPPATRGWIIPTDSVADSVASWVWVGEFVAACTRLGKMPTMYMGYAVEGAYRREAKYRNLKFHDKLSSRIEAGSLARQFLAQLRRDLSAVHSGEMDRIRQAAAAAVKARRDGHKLWAYLQGHTLLFLMGYPHDPGWFEPIHRDWNRMRDDAVLRKGDVVLCVGYDQIFQGSHWEDFAEQARQAGAALVWSFTDYKKDQVKSVPAGEIYINQHWPAGDAVAAIEGYDIKVLPTSGVLAEAILWMVHADMLELTGRAAHK